MMEDDDMVTIRAHHKKTGEVTIMKVKKGTPMGEVFKQYAEKKGLAQRSLSFVADGKMIPNSAKPMDLKKKESPELMPPGTPLHDDCGCACFGSIICDDFAEE